MGEWVGAPEAAKRLGVGLRGLYKLIDQGKIDAYQLGRLVRLKRADVEALAPSMAVRGSSKSEQARAYFADHRDEWLTPAEIVEAIGCGAALPSRVATAMNAERPGSVEIEGGSKSTRYRYRPPKLPIDTHE